MQLHLKLQIHEGLFTKLSYSYEQALIIFLTIYVNHLFLTIYVNHLQDKVYIRAYDLQDPSKVFGADLYYHRICLPSYINKYHRAKTKKETSNIIKPTKRDAFILYIDFLKTIFDAGTAIPLSKIRDIINDESNINIINSEHFAEKNQFCPSERANELLFVFSSLICINVVVKRLRSLDTTKNVAENLRKSFHEVDFDLNDKFCDRED